MPDSGDQAAFKAEAAAEKAEEAARRAEKASKRSTLLLVGGFVFALVGAVLAFALEESDASVLGVRLQPLGGVIFAAGVLLIAGAAIGSMGSGGGSTDAGSVKSIGGLIAVVTGITAVTALAIVTLTQLGDARDSIVAVTSSAFGIISAVVGAYLGIKITAETSAKAGEEAKHAAVAQHEANVKEQKIAAVNEAVDKLVSEDKVSDEQAKAIEEASVGAEAAARTPGPPAGGGGA